MFIVRIIQPPFAILWTYLLAVCLGDVRNALPVPEGPDHEVVLAKNQVTLLAPNLIFIDSENFIRLRSPNKITHVKLFAGSVMQSLKHQTLRPVKSERTWLSDEVGGFAMNIGFAMPFATRPETLVQFKVKFAYCADQNCKTEINSISEFQSQVSKHSFVIVGETEKPLYRPGETIRARFLVLTSAHFHPERKRFPWPDILMDVKEVSNGPFRPISEEERKRRDQEQIQLDKVSMINPKKQLLAMWRDVRFELATNLSFKLSKDVDKGTWSFVAEVFEEKLTLQVEVNDYQLPQFLSQTNILSSVSYSSKTFQFEICANYANGSPLRGQFSTQICLCSNIIWERVKQPVQQFQNDVCPNPPHSASVPRPCLRVNGRLSSSKNGCKSVNIEIARLMHRSIELKSWNDKLGVITKVADEETGTFVTQLKTVEVKNRARRNLRLYLPQVFRSGLPIEGLVTLAGDESVIVNKTILIEVSKQSDVSTFYRLGHAGVENPMVFIRNVTTNELGRAHFLLPPFHINDSLQVDATLLETISFCNTSRLACIRDLYALKHPISASAKLLRWCDDQSLLFQTKVINATRCPGNLTLEVTSNKPLNGRSIYIEFISRGSWQQIVSKLSNRSTDSACLDTDSNAIGHYVCNTGFPPGSPGEIACLPGWTGDNCLTPICQKNVNMQGGICIYPDKFVCKQGWRGKRCEYCITRNGCLHGVCRRGDDCVCNQGWTGPLCNRATVVLDSQDFDFRKIPIGIENQKSMFAERSILPKVPAIPESLPSLRTIFRYMTNIEMDNRWGPELRAVIYLYDSNKLISNARIVADFIHIDDLKTCTSPAIALSQNQGSSMKFNRGKTTPGALVSLNFQLPTKNETQSEKETSICLVRAGNNVLENPDRGYWNKLDINQFISALYRYTGRDRHSELEAPITSKAAFQCAGLNLIAQEYSQPKSLPHETVRQFHANYDERREETHGDSSPQAITSVPRTYNFFSDLWLFETVHIRGRKHTLNLTAPDIITSWKASGFCFIPGLGVWTPIEKTQQPLTVSLPIFVELTMPTQLRRGEIMHLLINAFVQSNIVPGQSPDCYGVQLKVNADNLTDWEGVEQTQFSMCLCEGDDKMTISAPLKARRLGGINVVVEILANVSSTLCLHPATDGNPTQNDRKLLSTIIQKPIMVIPEGNSEQTSVGGLICTTNSKDAVSIEEEITLPSEFVSDSLHGYVSLSVNVIGRALANLDSLIQLPTGCGEQNIVKVAPSVYVLRYLASTIELNGGKRGEKELIRKAIDYINKGFQSQLNYQHRDGSFSVFGSSDTRGSTWLTAFVFTVFSEAETILRSPALQMMNPLVPDMEEMLISAFGFLAHVQRTDGCFEETGRVFLPEIRGGSKVNGNNLTIKDLLLTAHVLSGISNMPDSIKDTYEAQMKKIAAEALKCIITVKDLDSMPNSVVARVSYALGNMHSKVAKEALTNWLAVLQNRNHQFIRQGEMHCWWHNGDDISDPALDVETTAYAYLSLRTLWPMSKRLSIIRWLSSHQKEAGGFYSTQDTVMALKVLADAAKELEMSPNVLKTLVAKVTVQASGLNALLNVFINSSNAHMPQKFPVNNVRGGKIRWSLESKTPICLALHYFALYNMPVRSVGEKPAINFEMQVRQGKNRSFECTMAIVTICIQPSSSRPGTGMLLLTLKASTGWSVNEKEIGNVHKKFKLNRIEVDEGENAQNTVSVYFDGFNLNDNFNRCLEIKFHQNILVENSKPGLLRIMHYYSPSIHIERPLIFDSCQPFWRHKKIHTIDSDEQKEIADSGPICMVPNSSDFDVFCQEIGWNAIFFRRFEGIAEALVYHNVIARWNASLDKFGVDANCVHSLTSTVIIFGKHPAIRNAIITGGVTIPLTNTTIVCTENLASLLSTDPKMLSNRCKLVRDLRLLLHELLFG